MIVAAEQEAIRAALVGSTIDQDRGDGARPDRVEDEPALDLGEGDDLYATWAYKPMRLTRTDVLAHATSTEVLNQ